jgi:fructose-1,6-bisphosphatase
MCSYLYSIVHQLTQQNQFGKTQSDLDLEADKIIFEQLKKSGVVHSAASEEKPFVSNREAL